MSKNYKLSSSEEKEVLAVCYFLQSTFNLQCPTIDSLIDGRNWKKLFINKNWDACVESFVHGHILHGATSKKLEILFRCFETEMSFIYRRILDSANSPVLFLLPIFEGVF